MFYKSKNVNSCKTNSTVWLSVFLFLFFGLISEAVSVDYDNKFIELEDACISTLDSLKRVLNTQPLSDKQQMDIYHKISSLYCGLEVDSSLFYSMKGIPLAQRLKEYHVLYILHTHVAAAHCFRSNYDSAFFYCDRLKELALEQGDKEWEAIALQFYAEVYRKQGKYHTAIDYYLKSLKICEDEGLEERCLAALIYLSEINRRLGNLDLALKYATQAEMAYNKSSKLVALDWRLTSILNEYAFNYLSRYDLQNALFYALKSDSINQNRFVENMCKAKGILATIHLRQNGYDLAMQYALESLEWADALKDRNLHAYSGEILSDIYMSQKKFPEAEAAALKVWMADSTNIDESRTVAKNIALANIYMQNTERAAYFLNKYAELNAQYAEKSFHTTMSDMEVKYETDKKETRIVALEKERQLNVLLAISGILLAGLLGIVLFQYIRNAHKQRRLVATEFLQKGEINERTRIAEELHDRLGGSLSAMKIGLGNADNRQHIGRKIDECMKEIREITNNIMPRTLRLYGIKAALEDLCAEFGIVRFHFYGNDKRINYNLEYTIYSCAKELVNNALIHAGAAYVNVQLVQSEKRISLTVQDDGCGFDEKMVCKGDGLQNIRNRIASLRGELNIFSTPGKGTETVIEIVVSGS
jgi:signal transduction histidine kinase